MDERQKLIFRVALRYMLANLGDVNDCMAVFSDADPDNEQGMIEVDGERHRAFSDGEIDCLLSQYRRGL